MCAQEEELESLLGMSIEEIREHAQSDVPQDLDALMPLLELLEVKASFLPGTVLHAKEALDASGNDIAMVNGNGIRVLSDVLSLRVYFVFFAYTFSWK